MGKANFHEGEPTNNDAFDFGVTKQGEPQYLTGPLSDLNTIPFRGSGDVAHNVDVDTLTKEWEYDPQSHETDGNHSPTVAAGDGGTFEEREPPVPLYVTVVEMPLETVERYSLTQLVIGPNETYTFTTPGALDSLPSRAVVGKDDTRTRVRVTATVSAAQLAGTATAQYAFWVSSEVSMAGAILLTPGVQFEFLGKTPGPYVKICPLAAYDPTKTNNMQLSAIIERVVLGSKKVK